MSTSNDTDPRAYLEIGPSLTVTATGSPLGGLSQSPAGLIGTLLLDRYRVNEMLGEGAMGAVFLGEHVTIGRKVAIKVLKLHAARSPEKAKQRFLREARMISMVSHDNVVQISDFGETSDGLPFFVMEYLEGETLAMLLRREGPQSWSRVRAIAIQICRALRAAHSVGLIHRDMKLENCFVVARPDAEDFVKVLDFGIAKIMKGDGDKPDGERLASLTRTGEVVGTAAYMAPEQAKGEPLDARTDLYSLGIMLYELLVGQRPVEADSVVGLMHKQAYEAPRKPSEVAPHAEITPSMEAVILKALTKNRDERYQTAGEMIEAIEMVSARRLTHPNIVGETLQGRYKLIERIGEGGMGTVYLARHTTIGRRLAVKVLHTEYVRLYKGRFLQEAKAASQIAHDNVVQITDYGEMLTGQPFLVMEYLEGEPLSATIKREGGLPWSRVKSISTQICRGLQSAHDAGIVHRDIKPDNCFRVSKDDNDDHIKILDFGIARMTTAGPKITVTGDIIGTAAYMSPEQARGDKELDHRVDVYGVGIMMYEMLTGVRPFDGDDDFAILHHHIYSQPKPFAHHGATSQIPPGAEAIVLKAIEKAPADRYSSMRELIKAITCIVEMPEVLAPEVRVVKTAPAVEIQHSVSPQVVSGHTIPSRAIVPPTPVDRPTIPAVKPAPVLRPLNRRAPWPLLAAGSVGVLSLVFGAVHFTVPRDEPARGSVSSVVISARGEIGAALHQRLEIFMARHEPKPESQPTVEPALEPEPEVPSEPVTAEPVPGPDPDTKPTDGAKKTGKGKVVIERVLYDCVAGFVGDAYFEIKSPQLRETRELDPGKYPVEYWECETLEKKVTGYSLRIGPGQSRRMTTKNPPEFASAR